jgi:hypothetical protein
MTDARRVSLYFRGRAADLDDLQAEISSALEELADPASGFAGQASADGFDSSEFARAEVSVMDDAKGFGDVVVLVAIFAPAATHALNKVWDDLIWPRVKSRLGGDALGEPEKPSE